MLCAECVFVSVYVCRNVGLCNSSFRVLNLVWFGFVLHFPGMLLIPNTWVCVSLKNTETSRISSPNFTAFCEGGESLTTNIYIEFVDISQSSSSFSYRFGLFTIFEIFALFLFFIQFLFCFWTPTIQFSFQFFLHYWLYIMRVCHSVYWFPNNYHSIVCSFYLLLFLLLHFCFNRNTKSLEFTSAYTLSTHSFSQHHTRGVQMYTGISRELKNTHKHKHSYTHAYADWSPFAVYSHIHLRASTHVYEQYDWYFGVCRMKRADLHERNETNPKESDSYPNVHHSSGASEMGGKCCYA